MRSCLVNDYCKGFKKNITKDPANWRVHLMDFVDDFRYYKVPSMISESYKLTDNKLDGLIASTIEYLCDELHIKVPEWVLKVPPLKEPWFVSGIENLKAITIVESPVYFRRRKIFVLENFLSRV